MLLQISISRAGVNHLADGSFEIFDVGPEDTLLAKQTGDGFVREAGMSGLILNKQDTSAPSNQTRLRVFDLCIKEAAYYLCLRVHVLKAGSGRSDPEAGRIMNP